MELWSVVTDGNFRERFDYPDSSFPLGVWTDDYKLMKNNMLDYHWHSDIEMGFLLSGEVDYFLAENKVHLKKGEGIFINSNTLHMAKPANTEEDTIMAVVCFQPEIFTQSKYTPLYVKYFQQVIDKDFSGCKIDPAVQFGSSVIAAMKELYELWEKSDNYELLCHSELCKTWHYTLEYLSYNEDKLVAKTSSS